MECFRMNTGKPIIDTTFRQLSTVIRMVGSGDADGIPALFCNCGVCDLARRNGGRDVRSRTAYRIGETVGIDLGPDSPAQEWRFQLHSEKLRHLFFTHSHADHLDPLPLLSRRGRAFASLQIYGNPEVIRQINLAFWRVSHTAFDGDFERYNLRLQPLSYFVPVEIVEEDMTVYPLHAWHAMESPTERPNLFVVRIGNRHVLFGNDSGYFPEDTWNYLAEKKFPLSVVFLDGTAGKNDQKDWHLGGKYIFETRERLERIGCCSVNSRWILTHIGHDCGMNHAELEEAFRPYGFEIGYDGMNVELADMEGSRSR